MIRKHFVKVPFFQLIVDTNNTPHYGDGKFLMNLLKPLAQSEYGFKDSFETFNIILKTPPELFDQDCQYFSFEVTSLFTNVHLQQTIDTIQEQSYKGKLINTKLRNNIFKKLVKDCCTKTAFSFNGYVCKRKDGVSMGSSLDLLKTSGKSFLYKMLMILF